MVSCDHVLPSVLRSKSKSIPIPPCMPLRPLSDLVVYHSHCRECNSSASHHAAVSTPWVSSAASSRGCESRDNGQTILGQHEPAAQEKQRSRLRRSVHQLGRYKVYDMQSGGSPLRVPRPERCFHLARLQQLCPRRLRGVNMAGL